MFVIRDQQLRLLVLAQLIRELQPYMVSLRPVQFAKAKDAGMIVELGGQFMTWQGPYDSIFGIETDRTTEALIW